MLDPQLACEWSITHDNGLFGCVCGAKSSTRNAMSGPCRVKAMRAAMVNDATAASDSEKRTEVAAVDITPDEVVARIGSGETQEVWSRLKQATSLVREISRWLWNGCPIRTIEERQAILAACAECPRKVIVDGSVTCGVCGCRAGKNDPMPVDDFGLKITLGTTTCPATPPRW